MHSFENWKQFQSCSVMPGSLNILVTSFFVFWLSRTTKIIFYVCLLKYFARQDRQNRNFKNKQNYATKVTRWQKTKLQKWHETNINVKNNLPLCLSFKLLVLTTLAFKVVVDPWCWLEDVLVLPLLGVPLVPVVWVPCHCHHWEMLSPWKWQIGTDYTCNVWLCLSGFGLSTLVTYVPSILSHISVLYLGT